LTGKRLHDELLTVAHQGDTEVIEVKHGPMPLAGMMVGMGNNPPVLEYADQNAGRWVPITQYRSELLVHMAASKLQAEGIRVFIEDHPRRAGAVRPARLNVLADEVPAAVSILMQTPAREYLLELPDEKLPLEYARPRPKRPISLSPWWIAFWLLLPWLLIFAWYAFLRSVHGP